MRNDKRESRRGDAIDTRGLADGARTRGVELLPNFDGEPGQLRIIPFLRQFEAFVPSIGGDVSGLARQIDVVLRIDLDLLRDFRWQVAEPRPDLCKVRDPDVRIREQLEGTAPLAILIEDKARAIRLA